MTVERPILRYFGGKFMIADWIISHFPPHRVYVEPFGGGASVLLRKRRCHEEIYNDLDGEIVNVFRVMRDNPDALRAKLELTPFSREEYDQAFEPAPANDPVERARRSLVRSFMGHGASGLTRNSKSGFRQSSAGQGTVAAKVWSSYPAHMASFIDRLMGVTIESRYAKEVIERHDSPETLFYIDPPYVHSSRSATKHGYRHEMDDDEHRELLELLRSLQGMVVLSGYSSSIYDQLDWYREDKETFADGAVAKTETLWINDLARARHKQMALFT